jgi:cell division protein FtsQ
LRPARQRAAAAASTDGGDADLKASTARGFGLAGRHPGQRHTGQRRPRPRHRRRRAAARHLLPLSVAVAAAIVFVTLTEGGSHARPATPVTAYVDRVLERVGLGLTQVAVRGQSMTRDSEIYDRLRLTDTRSVWLLDTEAARKRIETLPWVRTASLKRVFPDRLQIEIQERTPIAIWSDGNTVALIDATGKRLGPATTQTSNGRFASLPNIFGPGAPPHAAAIIGTINRLPVLRGRIALFEWTANRRWTLHLKSGGRVLLPATEPGAALVRLARGQPGRRLIDGEFKQLDLRLSRQIAVDLAAGEGRVRTQ